MDRHYGDLQKCLPNRAIAGNVLKCLKSNQLEMLESFKFQFIFSFPSFAMIPREWKRYAAKYLGETFCANPRENDASVMETVRFRPLAEGGGGAAGPRGIGQILQGSFSAVSKPNFASKYSFESSRRDLPNAILCTVLESNPRKPFSNLNCFVKNCWLLCWFLTTISQILPECCWILLTCD